MDSIEDLIRKSKRYDRQEILPASKGFVGSIFRYLPVEAKKEAHRFTKEWKYKITPMLKFNKYHPTSIMNEHPTTNTEHSNPVPNELKVTPFIFQHPNSINLTKAHKIHKLIFEDPNVSEGDMVWLLSKCYSIDEIQIIQKTEGEIGLRLMSSFLRSDSARCISMSSRTLKTLQIIGHKENLNYNPNIRKMNFLFDCQILKDCTSLRSFIIVNFPELELKNIDLIPSVLAHLAFEEKIEDLFEVKKTELKEDTEIERETKKSNGNEPISTCTSDSQGSVTNFTSIRTEDDSTAPTNTAISSESIQGKVSIERRKKASPREKKLVSFGFIDFSSPILHPVKTFQLVTRLTRLRKCISSSETVNGQTLLNSCQANHRFSTVWDQEGNSYKLKTSYKEM